MKKSIIIIAMGLMSCNLYTELERPDGEFDLGAFDVGPDGTDASLDVGNSDASTDASQPSDVRWRAIEIGVGENATDTVAWRVAIPDAMATEQFGPDGGFLRLFDAEGNPVAHQIEAWSQGAHIFWLSVDAEDATSRKFWLRYGTEPTESGPDADEVWNAGGYTNVWGFASDPSVDLPAWIGTKEAEPVEGEGVLSIGDRRASICVEGFDGWNADADSQFGVGRTSDGRTFEAVYRGDPLGSNGHILSTQDLCNGIGIFVTQNDMFGRLHAGTSCNPGFDAGQFRVTRPADDTTEFTHVAMTVDPISPGFDVTLYVDGSEVGETRVMTTNDIAGNGLEIGTFLGNEEHSLCLDQVHIFAGTRSPANVELAYRGTIGDGVSIGSEQLTPDFATAN